MDRACALSEGMFRESGGDHRGFPAGKCLYGKVDGAIFDAVTCSFDGFRKRFRGRRRNCCGGSGRSRDGFL